MATPGHNDPGNSCPGCSDCGSSSFEPNEFGCDFNVKSLDLYHECLSDDEAAKVLDSFIDMATRYFCINDGKSALKWEKVRENFLGNMGSDRRYGRVGKGGFQMTEENATKCTTDKFLELYLRILEIDKRLRGEMDDASTQSEEDERLGDEVGKVAARIDGWRLCCALLASCLYDNSLLSKDMVSSRIQGERPISKEELAKVTEEIIKYDALQASVKSYALPLCKEDTSLPTPGTDAGT